MSDEKSAYEQLNNKQRAFVDAYIAANFNATRAARIAGYAQPHSQGPRLLENVGIQNAIRERMSAGAMAADEVMQRLANYARFDVSEFVRVPVLAATSLADEGEPVDEDDPVSDKKSRNVEPYVDVLQLIEAGYGYAIKTIKQTANGAVIEFHDPVGALQLIGKHLKLFTERQEIELTEPIVIIGDGDVQSAEEKLAAWRRNQQQKQSG